MKSSDDSDIFYFQWEKFLAKKRPFATIRDHGLDCSKVSSHWKFDRSSFFNLGKTISVHDNNFLSKYSICETSSLFTSWGTKLICYILILFRELVLAIFFCVSDVGNLKFDTYLLQYERTVISAENRFLWNWNFCNLHQHIEVYLLNKICLKHCYFY